MQCKAKIKIDVDNVLNDMCAAQIAIYNERHGTNLRIDDCIQYDFRAYGDDASSELMGMFGDPELYERMRPPENAVKYLFLLSREFDVKLVTATRPEDMCQKIKWILSWFPFMSEDSIIIASDKRWIEADYAIDDHLGYLLRDSARRIVIDRPWNRAVRDYVYGLRRVADLKEAYEIITTLEREDLEDYDSF